MKRGLNRQTVVTEAMRMIEDIGYAKLTVRELAARLGIKPASLYNHFDGIEDILLSVAERSGELLERAIGAATEGKNSDMALKDGAVAYLVFAAEHHELYLSLINAPKADNERNRSVGAKSFACFARILRSYGIERDRELHLMRMLRAMLHGYVELCESGFMSHSHGDRRESFDFAIAAFIELVHAHSP